MILQVARGGIRLDPVIRTYIDVLDLAQGATRDGLCACDDGLVNREIGTARSSPLDRCTLEERQPHFQELRLCGRSYVVYDAYAYWIATTRKHAGDNRIS